MLISDVVKLNNTNVNFVETVDLWERCLLRPELVNRPNLDRVCLCK